MTKLVLASVPPIALWLGAAGLIPFAAGLLGTALPALAIIGPAGLLLYGAVILSFMGGVHWGLAIAAGPVRPLQLVVSVMPALLAWVAALVGGIPGLLLESLGFVVLFGFDLVATDRGWAPIWYPALRVRLTAGAVACLLGAAAFA